MGTDRLGAAPPLPIVVGLGASAGGLEALLQFLDRVPPRSGLAFVVVQHLDPSQPTLLSQLLQRGTPMPVAEANEAVRIAPDHVYVIPPNRALTVAQGQLHLALPTERRGMRLPIDALFESLAADCRERAVGVVLSGMGSDGTLGLRAIRAAGGLTLAQAPETAPFAAMPASAIASGCVDIVDAPQGMPARIVAALADAPRGPRATASAQTAAAPAEAAPAEEPAPPTADPFAAILTLLAQRGGHDFTQYKHGTLQRRIERRMRVHDVASLQAYLAVLQANPQELGLLGRELLIGVTGFFRDAAEWQHLAEQGLPRLLAERTDASPLRAWVVACSTGEEAYSIAMLLAEARDAAPPRDPSTSRMFRIFATDVSTDAIDFARRGHYPAAIAADVSAPRLARFFTPEPGGYRIAPSIRDTVVFAPHDVNSDAPFTKLDLLCCRNLLIYLVAPLQQRLLRLFHFSLNPGGLLLLGNSEGLGNASDLFEPVDGKARLFRRIERGVGEEAFFPVRRSARTGQNPKEPHVSELPSLHPNLQNHAERLLLNQFSPPAVLVNRSGDILYIHGRTGKFLEPASGKVNWNIHAMAREGLRVPLGAALREAIESKTEVQRNAVTLSDAGEALHLDLTVRAVQEPGALAGTLLIVFLDHPPGASAASARAAPVKSSAVRSAPQAELAHAREEAQALRQEMKASREELQAANEELQSTNEELQSTNEELTSSKEELQSMNEELQSVNAELRAKLDDLALAQSDMKNLLDSTQIATLFLDNDLNVRRFTEQASKIVSLRETDIGRPLSDLTSSLDYPDLQADARETLRSLAACEKQVATRDKRWFNVRIMPYRSLENAIRGVVITLVDITAAKELEAKLRAK
jgi:two-component system, chemotaxis family, CheB/CheR fusion protein